MLLKTLILIYVDCETGNWMLFHNFAPVLVSGLPELIQLRNKMMAFAGL